MNDTRLLVIAGGLFVFGLIYAYLIAIRPFRPSLTWLEVVIGDAVTDTGMSLAIYLLTNDLRLAALPWIAHALTGGSMILGQLLKHHLLRTSAEAARHE